PSPQIAPEPPLWLPLAQPPAARNAGGNPDGAPDHPVPAPIPPAPRPVIGLPRRCGDSALLLARPQPAPITLAHAGCLPAKLHFRPAGRARQTSQPPGHRPRAVARPATV